MTPWAWDLYRNTVLNSLGEKCFISLIISVLVRRETRTAHSIKEESKPQTCTVVFPFSSLTLIHLFAFFTAAQQWLDAFIKFLVIPRSFSCGLTVSSEPITVCMTLEVLPLRLITDIYLHWISSVILSLSVLRSFCGLLPSAFPSSSVSLATSIAFPPGPASTSLMKMLSNIAPSTNFHHTPLSTLLLQRLTIPIWPLWFLSSNHLIFTSLHSPQEPLMKDFVRAFRKSVSVISIRSLLSTKSLALSKDCSRFCELQFLSPKAVLALPQYRHAYPCFTGFTAPSFGLLLLTTCPCHLYPKTASMIATSNCSNTKETLREHLYTAVSMLPFASWVPTILLCKKQLIVAICNYSFCHYDPWAVFLVLHLEMQPPLCSFAKKISQHEEPPKLHHDPEGTPHETHHIRTWITVMYLLLWAGTDTETGSGNLRQFATSHASGEQQVLGKTSDYRKVSVVSGGVISVVRPLTCF